MKYRTIIFDLDGTIINTLEDLSDAMNYSLKKLGLPERTSDECKMMIGNGARLFAERALPQDKIHLTDQVLSTMKSRYRDHCCSRSRIYEGIDDLIRILKEKGCQLAVITNKPHEQAVLIVEHYFGKGAFDRITGAIDGKPIKPDPTSTFEMMTDLGAKQNECLFIGDSDVDIQTAKAAGITSVGVTWGFRDRKVLEKAKADEIVDSANEILDLAT